MGEKALVNSGDKYGSLTIIKELPKKVLPSGQTNRVFQCKCDCGNVKEVRFVHLRNNRTKTCGRCMFRNKSECDEYVRYIRKVWRSIKTRVSPDYFESHLYYEKGITICEEWERNFDSFYKWANENGLKKGLQVDRVDNAKGYSPDNCRAATPFENINNRDVTFFVNYNKKKIPFMEVIEGKGLRLYESAIRSRIKRGWSAQEAIDTPIKMGRYVRKRTIDKRKQS